MKKMGALALFCLLLASPVRAESTIEFFAKTNWNTLAAGIYGDYIFYRTHMDRPNMDYFKKAMAECRQKLAECLHGGELDWQDAALTRFKNLVALGQVALYEMNRYAADENFTSPALETIGMLREAYAAMREKDIFSSSETDFMRRFRRLEDSGIVARTCAGLVATRDYRAPSSSLRLEYVKYNDNVQHALFYGSSGNQSCAWSGNCIREAGGRISCRGVLGSGGGFEARQEGRHLVVQSQSLEEFCGYPAMAGVYELE